MKTKYYARAAALLTAFAFLSGCGAATSDQPPSPSASQPAQSVEGEKTAYEGEVSITLSDGGVLVNAEAVTGDETAPVYAAHDIVYYEDRDNYDSGNPYGEGEAADRHTAEEAESHTVVHITAPGVYRVSGTLSRGQIAVDLGEDAKLDPDAVVTLVLDGADITCTVAPAVIFYRVYECDTQWVAYDEGEAEDYTASPEQDTSAAGARVILADGSVNNVNGSYVARIYKDKEGEKKLHKYDGAFYSKMSMEISGEAAGTGVLNITAENEGLDSELHLTINGGCINIQAQNDGVNTNEDGVSVTTVNGGALHIVAGLGAEGDGVDSNGYLVINGGTVIAAANPASDSGLDSDLGSYVNGGWVLAMGSTMDWAESDSAQVTMNLQFAARQEADEAIVVTDTRGNVVFAYDPDKDETTGEHNRSYQGAVLSCPGFAVGETYYVYVGGDVTGSEVNGLYDPATVTSFEGAVRQQYTGSDVGRGHMGGGMRPGDWDEGERPEPPEGWTPGEDMKPSEGFGKGEPPEGFDKGERPQPTEGMEPGRRPDGFRPENSGQTAEEGEPSVEFYMADAVNSFSGITDETA